MPTKKTAKPEPVETPPVPTFAELAEQKTRAHLESYRDAVHRAAAGEAMGTDELEQVIDHLRELRLPEAAWEADIQATRQAVELERQIQAADENRPKQQAEALRCWKEIESTRERLRNLEAQHARLTTTANHLQVGHRQRYNELQHEHPHVLQPMPQALELHKHRQQKRQRALLPGSGWEPVA